MHYGRQSSASTKKPHDLLILLLKKLDTNAHSKSQEPEVEQIGSRQGKARQGSSHTNLLRANTWNAYVSFFHKNI